MSGFIGDVEVVDVTRRGDKAVHFLKGCFRDIYYAKYYGKGGGKEMVSWGKNEN